MSEERAVDAARRIVERYENTPLPMKHGETRVVFTSGPLYDDLTVARAYLALSVDAARLQVIAERITGPCSCIPAYKDRGLIAPDCVWHDRAEEIVDALKAERALSGAPGSVAPNAALLAFAKDAISEFWERDSADMQEFGIKHGLLVAAAYDPALHGDDIEGTEPGDEIYVYADWFKDASVPPDDVPPSPGAMQDAPPTTPYPTPNTSVAKRSNPPPRRPRS